MEILRCFDCLRYRYVGRYDLLAYLIFLRDRESVNMRFLRRPIMINSRGKVRKFTSSYKMYCANWDHYLHVSRWEFRYLLPHVYARGPIPHCIFLAFVGLLGLAVVIRTPALSKSPVIRRIKIYTSLVVFQ